MRQQPVSRCTPRVHYSMVAWFCLLSPPQLVSPDPLLMCTTPPFMPSILPTITLSSNAELTRCTVSKDPISLLSKRIHCILRHFFIFEMNLSCLHEVNQSEYQKFSCGLRNEKRKSPKSNTSSGRNRCFLQKRNIPNTENKKQNCKIPDNEK